MAIPVPVPSNADPIIMFLASHPKTTACIVVAAAILIAVAWVYERKQSKAAPELPKQSQ